jgi:hypothetical protein
MKHTLKLVLSAWLMALALALPASAAQILIGTGNGSLGILDTSDNSVTALPSTSQVFFDIAIDPTGGTAYGITGSSTLYSIDISTGLTASIGSLGVGANALTFDNSGTTLYAAGGGTLYTVNTGDGSATSLGGIGSSYASSGDLAFDSLGILYGTSSSGPGDSLFSIDPGGVAGSLGTLIGAILDGATNISSVFGLAFADNILFGLTSGNDLYSLNRATAAATSLGSYAISGQTFGATVIPIPAALPLFGTGLGILGFLGWRRRRKAV